MVRLQLFLFAMILLVSCKPSTTVGEESKTAADTSVTTVVNIPGLKRVWDTEKTLTTAESVLYDKANNLLYVSCINGVPPDKKDGDGFISRIDLDGKIKDLKWVTGLNAPKGMGQIDNTLYVTDIDRLVSIDITTGKISNTWKVEGASFLNDISIAEDGSVYFTDSNTSTVYALQNNKIEVLMADGGLGGTNGIFIEGNSMYLAGFESGVVYRMDLATKAIQKVAVGIPFGDGIERYGDGWLVSNWSGEIYYVDSKGESTNILNTQEAKLNSADIEVIAEKNLLLIPTFFGNGVTAYELSKNN